MPSRKPRYTIILAAGKGTRMQSADRHKVCFPVDGRPAINRALEVYKTCGIREHIVVVGSLAEQVMQTVAQEHPGVLYAYQSEQLGTGHAARVGLRALEALDHEADLLLVAGDRLIEPMALERLIDLFYAKECDLAFMVGPKAPRSTQGRVLLNGDGSPLAVVEMRDIQQREALARLRALVDEGRAPGRAEARRILTEQMDERRAAVSFDWLWPALQGDGPEPSPAQWDAWISPDQTRFAFRAGDGVEVSFAPDRVLAAEDVNVSVYLLKATALRYALDRLNTDNAQHEEYLSDIINLLAQPGDDKDAGGRAHRVRALRVDDPHAVMGYNNPDELLEVEVYYRRKREAGAAPPALEVGPGYRPVAEWRTLLLSGAGETETRSRASVLASETESLEAELRAVYGDDASLLGERRSALRRVLGRAGELLGEQTPVLLVRAPGRVNILGRHVDHQGGNCNLLAIDREIVMAVHPRGDDQVILYNVAEEPFGTRQFAIGDLLSRLPWDDWLSLINSQQVREMVSEAHGDWSQYVRAAVLRLQNRFPTFRLRGMDLVVMGNIPIAAGLSSSSALVVAAAEATLATNGLELLPAQFVDLCGEGEWFVGTRGGSADHAAMKLGEKGKVTQVTFFEFGIVKKVDFPEDYRLVICNSGIQARKAAGARDVFNHRVACYRLGLRLVRAQYPQYAPLIEHLRDVNMRKLGIPLSWVYRILLSLPENATRDELAQMLPVDQLAPLLATHAAPTDGYPVRGVVLFGLAECERSRLGADLLTRGQVLEFGRLMSASHDGDRVVCHDAAGTAMPYAYRVTNGYLLNLMAALESGDAERVIPAQLQWQPGAYRCSTPEIDLMVDTAMQVPGVVGAQLAGAGLGGCMMVLVRREQAGALVARMDEAYYGPRNIKPDMAACKPIAGSGVLLNPRHVRRGN